MLRISLLGGFLIEHEGRGLPPISSSAGRSLLAYLVTYRGRRHTRDLLAGTFWPERSESSARKRLSQALWQIHTALRSTDADESLIEVTPSQVSFNPDSGSYWLDIEEFENLVDKSRNGHPRFTSNIEALERAVSLYRGDFLAGFYDDWMLVERERLSDLYLHTLERLVALHKGRSDYRSALSHARRIVLEDPVRESAHREVMRLNFLLGRSTEALQQYDRCDAILREELGVEPSAQTRLLRREIDQLRDKGDRPFVPSVDAPMVGDPRKIPLVGRSKERASIVRRIEDTLVGRGGVVLVEGESGIGKTRLTNELINDTHWRGVNAVFTRAEQETQLRPYHTIAEAMRSGVTRLRARQLAEILDDTQVRGLQRVAPEVTDLFPVVPEPLDLPPDESRRQIKSSLEDAFIALGELAAHVIFIDDAHWMDTESFDVLEGLVSHTKQIPLLVYLAYRSDEARDRPDLWRSLMHIDEKAHPHRVVLGKLTFERTSQLIHEASGAVVLPSVAEGVFHETGGNPLFVLETLRTMNESSDRILRDDPDPEVGDEVSSGVARVIQQRLRHLGAEARVVLNAAATLGSRFNTNLLTRMSRLEPAMTLQGLSELLQRGVIVELADGYEFSHQQMKVVAEASLRSRVRRRLHREAAAALEAEHPERIEDLAYHYAEAGMAKEAMHLAWQAGSRAITLASFETAARYLRDATNWADDCDPEPDDYFELLCDLESTLDVLGDREGQLAAIDLLDSVTRDDPARSAETGRRRSNVLAQLGDYVDALDVARAALENAEDTDDVEVLSAVERTVGKIHSLSGHPVDALPHLERSVALIAGQPAEEADVRHALGDVLVDLQRYDAAAHHLDQTLALYEESGNLRGVTDTKALLGILAMEQGQVDDAEERYREAIDLAGRLGYRRAEAACLGNLANVHYLQGRIGDALAQSTEAAKTFLSIGDRRGSALVYANTASVRHIILGDDPTAESEARRALEFFESEAHEWGTAFCLEILAGVAERNGDTPKATELLERGLSLATKSGHRWLEVHLLRHLADIEFKTGDPSGSALLLGRARELCLSLGLSDVLPTIDGLASQVARERGDVDEAVSLARQATDRLTHSTEQSYRVWYQRYLAEQGAGNRGEAEKSLEQAWSLLDETLARIPQASRDVALLQVPVNQSIAKARREMWPETLMMTLPRDDVPRGRHLEAKDKVDVRWTVSHPTDFEIADHIVRRRHRICRLIAEASSQGASPRVVDLAQALSTSEATLRRDLTAIREAGKLVSTRGSRHS